MAVVETNCPPARAETSPRPRWRPSISRRFALVLLFTLALLSCRGHAKWDWSSEVDELRRRAGQAGHDLFRHPSASSGAALIVAILVGTYIVYRLVRLARRQRVKIVRTPAHTITADAYVVDGLNVAFSFLPKRPGNKDQASLPTLVSLLVALHRQGLKFMCYFDASAPHHFRVSGGRPVEADYRNLVADFPDWFTEVPAGTNADLWILDEAHRSGNPIITNDVYRDHQSQFTWLQNERDRRIGGKVVGETIRIPPLGISAPILPLQKGLWTLRESLARKA